MEANKICSKCGIVHQGPYKNLCKKCYNQRFKESHGDYLKDYYKNYNMKRKDKQSIYNKNYRETHDMKKYWTKRNRKIALDPLLKVKSDVRKHINNTIKRSKINMVKSKHTEDILGCTIENFKKYITSLFVENMSWDNYGEWHLDHTIPLCTATTEEEVYRLCHYTNYQPLWAHDNLVKGGKYNAKSKAE